MSCVPREPDGDRDPEDPSGTLDELYNEYGLVQAFQELEDENPRAGAIVGAVVLEEMLGDLIARSLIDDEKAVEDLLGAKSAAAPLGTFSSRILAAYCMGLISRKERDSLDTIRRIRNEFAHGPGGLSFDEPHIAGLCKKLWSGARKPEARECHRLGVVFLCVELGIKLRQE